MTFINPIFLSALAAVAIPVIVHILSRRRVPVIYFSSLRFLRPSDRRSMKRINLRRLVLLLLRIAGIALIALAFSRPVVRGGLAALFPGGGALSGCILVDRSYSMGVDEEEGTLFERAKMRAGDIIEGFEAEDEVTLMLFDSGNEIRYTGGGGSPEILVDGERVSWGTTDLRAAVQAGLGALSASRREIRELYIVSDFQRSAIAPRAGGALPEAGAIPRAEAGTKEEEAPFRAYLVPVRADEVQNVSIESVDIPRVALHRGELASVEVLLRNGSPGGSARFPIEVYLDGRRILEREVEIGPAAFKRESLAFPVERSGWLRGEVRKSADRLRADDVRFFALRVIDKVRVLLLADERALYLEQALCPEGSDGDIELVRKEWRALTSADLERADVAVLGPGKGPLRRDVTLIERFVSEGGKALVMLVPELADAARAMSGHPLSIRLEDAGAGFVSIARPPAWPDFLAPFDTEDIDAITRLRFRRVAVVSGVPSGWVLLRFSNGSPFMWEEERDEGSYIFCAADPTPEAGDFVLSPYFLPVVQQAVLATGPLPSHAAEITVSEPIVWEGAVRDDMRYVLPARAPGGGLRVGVPARIGGAQEGRIVVPPAEAPGFVILRAGGDTLGVFAVNPETGAESDISAASGDEVADSLGLQHYVVIGEDAQVSEAIRSVREGREITLALALAAIAVFVVESVVAQRKYEGDQGVG
jgi:hypothetical protein